MVSLAIVLSTTLFAQPTTNNTYSLYSMYGLGDLETQGTLSTRSTGGAGVAVRSGASINLLNPASYSVALQRGILFDYGMEGGIYRNSQNTSSGVSSSRFLTANFHDVALQIPLAKGIGLGISVSPYSSLGYNFSTSYNETSLGYISQSYSGSGNVTDIKVGVGYKITDRLSIGAAMRYYWGQIDRSYTLAITPITAGGSYSSTQGLYNNNVSKIKGQFGLQWDVIKSTKYNISLGATYDIGGNLSPESTIAVAGGSLTGYDVIARYDIMETELNLPSIYTIGLTINSRTTSISIDYTLQEWKDESAGITTNGLDVTYTDVGVLKAGFEYIPNRADIRHYHKRISYRAGARYGNYYLSMGGEDLPQWAASVGCGLPINILGITKLDIGFEYGGVGSHKAIQGVDMIRENYFKFSFGVTLFGDDYWFQRPKYD